MEGIIKTTSKDFVAIWNGEVGQGISVGMGEVVEHSSPSPNAGFPLVFISGTTVCVFYLSIIDFWIETYFLLSSFFILLKTKVN